MTIPVDVFAHLPPRPYDEVRAMAHDGDIMLCSANDLGSRMIRWGTRSLWSHIAIVMHLRTIRRVLVLECVQRIGVRAVPLSDFISRTSSGQRPYPGRILMARHQDMPKFDGTTPMQTMSGFAFDRLGAHFSTRETIKIAARIVLSRFGSCLPSRLQPDDDYICSEYVAGCFDAVGIKVPWDGRGFIAPADFANDPKINPVVQVQTR